MKTLKKSLALLLALVMCLSLMSVGVWADDSDSDSAPDLSNRVAIPVTANEDQTVYGAIKQIPAAMWDGTNDFSIGVAPSGDSLSWSSVSRQYGNTTVHSVNGYIYGLAATDIVKFQVGTEGNINGFAFPGQNNAYVENAVTTVGSDYYVDLSTVKQAYDVRFGDSALEELLSCVFDDKPEFVVNCDQEFSVTITVYREIPASAVAQIGNEYYATLAEAVTAAASKSGTEADPTVIQLLAGTIEEGTVMFPATLENVKIQGAVDADGKKVSVLENTILKAYYNPEQHYNNISIDSIVFDNSRLLFSSYNNSTYSNWAITNCDFKDIDSTSESVVHFQLSGTAPIAGLVFTGNTISGVTSSTASPSGLRVSGINGDVTVTGNVFENIKWNAIQLINSTADAKITISGNILGSNADEGVVNLFGGTPANISVTYNVFNLGENQPAIANLSGVDVSGNYWGGSAPSATALGNNVYSSYYNTTTSTTEAGFTLSNPQFGESVVATIGTTGYTTLADAVAAAQDGDTVTLLADVDITAVLEVKKNLTIEGGSHTVSVDTTRGLRVEKDNVALTLKDITFSGLNNKMERGVQVDGGKTGVTLNLDRCRIENCTYYAVNVCNYVTGLTLNIDNSYIAGWGAVNLWGEGYHVNIKDSTLVGYNDKGYDADGWNDFGTVILEGDTTGQTTEHSENCTVVLENCKVSASTNGQGNHQYAFLFNNPSAYNTVTVGSSETVVEVENGADYIAGISGEGNVLNIIGGTFDKDPRGYLNEGYAAVKQDSDTWKVGKAETTKSQSITTGQDTYTVTTTVKEDNTTLAESSASVAVKSGEAVGTTVDSVELTNVNTEAIAQTVAELNVGAKTIDIDVVLNKEDDTSAAAELLGEAVGEVFEVYPEASYVAKDENGDVIETGKMDVSKTTVGSFTFKLYLGSGFTSGQLVTVEHYGNGDDKAPTETWTKKVQSDDNGLYVELTLSSFSHVAVKAAGEGATVNYTVKIADATSGTAVIYPGDSVTMDVTVSGDDFYGGDFTIEYNETAFVLNEVSLPAGITVQTSHTPGDTTDKTKYQVNYNLVNGGALLTDGSKIFSVIFKAKDTLTATATYDFKVVSASVNYDTNKNADIVDCTENSTFVTNDKVTVNAAKYTVTFDGYSNDWAYSVYKGKGVDTIPTDVQTGYTFKGWALTNTATTALTKDEIRNAAVTANVTYYPVFEAEQYNVTLSGATGDAKATFGQNYIATISDYDANNYDYTVTYKSGTAASKTLTPTDESITIPAADITGDMTVTVEKTLKGFDVEVHADYVTGYTLVLVKAAEGNNSNPIYTYGASGENTGAMFFVKELTKANESKAYGAYAILVEGAITESAARAKVGITSTAATELTVQTDVNATDLVDSSDLQAAFSGYKVQLTLPEQMKIYLRADVNGDYKLDTADVGLVNNARTQ